VSQTFVFRAVDTAGAKVTGEVDSDSRDGVIYLLRERGLLPLDVKNKTASVEISFDSIRPISLEEIAVLTRQLATMITAGLALMRALSVLESQIENPRLRNTIIAVRQDIETGASLSGALEKYPKIFSELFVAMIRAGETGGFLEDALVRVADQLEFQAKLRRQVRGAMVYPAVVTTIALVVLVVMLVFIIPVFAGVFTQFDAKMPSLTVATMDVSDAFRHEGYLIVLGVVAIVFGFRQWKQSKSGRPIWDRMRLKAPFKIGDVVKKISLARWSRTLASLTTAGVPMLEAIEVTGRTAGNTVVERAMTTVRESVQGGGSISTALAAEPIFPALVTNMVRVGEETGELDTTLAKVAEYYEEQVDVAVKSLTSILEPVMICVIGGLVGFVIISMYLPMFQVYNAIN
jgi:type IV pilus assembly protein PilC